MGLAAGAGPGLRMKYGDKLVAAFSQVNGLLYQLLGAQH